MAILKMLFKILIIQIGLGLNFFHSQLRNSKFYFKQKTAIKQKQTCMVNINKYIKALLHPAGGHQGSHKAHQAGN